MGCTLTAAIDSPAPTGQGEPARHNTTTTAQRRPYVVKARASSDPSSVGGAGSTFTLGGGYAHQLHQYEPRATWQQTGQPEG